MAERKSKKRRKDTRPDFSGMDKVFSNFIEDGEPYIPINDDKTSSYLSPDFERPENTGLLQPSDVPYNPLKPRKPKDPIEYSYDFNTYKRKPKNIQDLANLVKPASGSKLTYNEASLLDSLGLLDASYQIPKQYRQEMQKKEKIKEMEPSWGFPNNPKDVLFGTKTESGEKIPGLFDYFDVSAEIAGAFPAEQINRIYEGTLGATFENSIPILNMLFPDPTEQQRPMSSEDFVNLFAYMGNKQQEDIESVEVRNKESEKLLMDLITGESELTTDETINAITNNFDDRAFGEQLALSFLSPENYTPVGAIGTGAKAGIASSKVVPAIAQAGLPSLALAIAKAGSVGEKGFAVPNIVYKFKDENLKVLERLAHTVRFSPPQLSPKIRDPFVKTANTVDEFLGKYFINQRRWFDRNAQQVNNEAKNLWGEDIPVEWQVGNIVTLIPGSESKILQQSQDAFKEAIYILDDVKENLGYVNTMLLTKHMINTLEMHPDRILTKQEDLTKWLETVYKSQGDVEPVDPVLDYIDNLKRADANMEIELGAELYNKVERASKVFVNAMDRKLQEALDEGMIDPVTLARLRKEYPWYHPTYYLDELQDALNGFDEFIPSGYRTRVDKPGNLINKLSEEGRDLRRVDPTEAFVSYMVRADKFIEQNRVKREFITSNAFFSETGQVVGQLITTKLRQFSNKTKDIVQPKSVLEPGTKKELKPKIKTTDEKYKFTEGYSENAIKTGEISFLANNGKAYTYDVSAKAFSELNNLLTMGDHSNLGKITYKLVRDNALAHYMRGAWIQYNPITLTALAIADIQTVMFARGVPLGLRQLLYNPNDDVTILNSYYHAWRSVFTEDEAMRSLIENRGDVMGLFGTTPRKMYENYVKDIKKGKTYSNPLVVDSVSTWKDIYKPSTIRKLTHATEMAPRLAVYRQEIAKGTDPMAAAIQARNATGDFQKMGIATQKLNAAFWFLNATLQGILAPYHAVKNNPKTFLKGMSGYLTIELALWQWNRQFEEYQDVPLDEQRGFYISLPSNQYRGGRKVPHGFLIPNYFGYVNSPLRYALAEVDERMRNIYPEFFKPNTTVNPNTWQDALIAGAGALNPAAMITGQATGVSPTGLFSGELDQSVTTVTPTMYKKGTEILLNINSFTGKAIEPAFYQGITDKTQRFNEFTTSETAKRLSKFFPFLSPFQIDHLIDIGGVPNDMLIYLDRNIKPTDPDIEFFESQYDVMIDSTPPDELAIKEKQFINDIEVDGYTAKENAELRQRFKEYLRVRPEIQRQEGVPVLSQFVNRYIKERGGAMWRAGLEKASKIVKGVRLNPKTKEIEEYDISIDETRRYQKRAALVYAHYITPKQIESDNDFYNGTINLAQWETEKHNLRILVAGALEGASDPTLGSIVYGEESLPFAAQASLIRIDEETGEVTNVYQEWTEVVNTYGGLIESPLDKGAWFTSAYYAIPVYDYEGNPIQDTSNNDNINYSRLAKDQRNFVNSLSKENKKAFDDWRLLNGTEMEQRYRKAQDAMAPYYSVYDMEIEWMDKNVSKEPDENGVLRPFSWWFNQWTTSSGAFYDPETKQEYIIKKTAIAETYTPINNINGQRIKGIAFFEGRKRELQNIIFRPNNPMRNVSSYANNWINDEIAQELTRYDEVINFPDKEKDSKGNIIASDANIIHYVSMTKILEKTLLEWGRVTEPRNTQIMQEISEKEIPFFKNQYQMEGQSPSGVDTPQLPIDFDFPEIID